MMFFGVVYDIIWIDIYRDSILVGILNDSYNYIMWFILICFLGILS